MIYERRKVMGMVMASPGEGLAPASGLGFPDWTVATVLEDGGIR